jgi:uncharacterized protein (UPF0332 family)
MTENALNGLIAYRLQQETDYGNMVHVSDEQVREALERATVFVARVGEFLKSLSA